MMQTTTSHMQKVPNFFTSKEECDANNHNSRPQTNLRYRGYTQTHFTCGDEDQFNQYRDFTNKSEQSDALPKENIYYSIENLYIPFNDNINLNPLTVSNTFRYIFHKFKKGIFIKFVNGEMRVFLPFSKNNFENEWSDKIGLTPGYKTMYDFIQHVYVVDKRAFNPKRVNKFIKSWIGNNSIVRFEFPCTEEDTGIPAFADMFYELSKKRKIKDVEFFFNKRDFPIIKRNHTEAYDEIYGYSHPLVSHDYDKYAPILGCSTTDEHADIPCPTWDDWSRVSSCEGKMFTKSNFDYSLNDIKWEDKLNVAVFRGSSTGSGTTIETNPRLKVAYLSSLKLIDDTDGNLFIDAGITSWNVRPRKNASFDYLQTIEVDTLPFTLVPKLTPSEQQKYKYIIHIQGHVCAYRLSLEMAMGSLILKVDSTYKIWFDTLIKPYVHYIPVKSDLSDLIDKIKWCKNNDSKCKEIAQNAIDFYNKYLTKDGILDYLQKILYDVSVKAGEYKYITKSAISIQSQTEIEYIKKSHSEHIIPYTSQSISGFTRSHAILEGVRLYFNKTDRKIDNISQSPIFKSTNTEIYNGEIAGLKVAIKNFNEIRKDECIHEIYIGLNVINHLNRIVPNFAHMYGFNKTEDSVITEHIEGITFHEYLNDTTNFIFNDYISIMLQIALTLQVAQNEYSFVHWDLMPWNIVLKRVDTPQMVEYPVSNTMVIKIYTKIIPIILDYGKSHAVIDGIHVGRMNMFKFTSIQDILTLLFSSMYSILTQHKLQQPVMKQFFELTTFFIGTQFRKDAFTSVVELRKFLLAEKKYSVITTSNKFELENKTPLDFVNFLVNKKLTKVIIDKKCNYIYDDGNSEYLIEDYLVSKSLDMFTNRLTAKLGIMCLDLYSISPNEIDDLYKVQEIKLTILFFEKFSKWLCKNFTIDGKDIFSLIEHIKTECELYKQTGNVLEFENCQYIPDFTEEEFNFPDKINRLISTIKHIPEYKTDPYVYYRKLRKLGIKVVNNWNQNNYTNLNTLLKYSKEIV